MPPFLRVIAKGEYPVDVFIILSGFVITRLLAEKQERYLVFIGRRFLRLFPVFAVTLLIAILLRPLLGRILAAGWPADPVILRNSLAAWENESRHFWAHLIAHLSILHGTVPSSILPGSATAFLAPAWSISLEWQYYLFAPLFALICRKFGPLGWLALAVGSILMLFHSGPIMSSSFPMQSFLPQKLLLFLVGGSCYWIFQELAGKHADLPWLLFFFIAPAVLWFTLSVPLAIWTAAFALTLSGNRARGVSTLKAFLNLAWIRRLGEVSYSTYLVHPSCILLAQTCILVLIPSVARAEMLLGLLITTPILTFFASEALFRFVERPGIRLGRRLAQRSDADAA